MDTIGVKTLRLHPTPRKEEGTDDADADRPTQQNGAPVADWKLLVDGMDGTVRRKPTGPETDDWDDV